MSGFSCMNIPVSTCDKNARVNYPSRRRPRVVMMPKAAKCHQKHKMSSKMEAKNGYGGINTTENFSIIEEDRKIVVGDDRGGGEESGWLHIPPSSPSLSLVHDDETRSLSSSKVQSLEMGASDDYDPDQDSADDYEDDADDDEEYELIDYATALHPTMWRPKERLRCISTLILTFLIASIAAYFQKHQNASTLQRSRPPPGAVGVGHAAYDTLHSSWLEEYDARLTLYRHRSTGAEFLAFIPDSTRSGPTHSGRGYDPRPDRVFGVAFRTPPKTSTGVPHILEREYLRCDRRHFCF